MGPGAFGVWKFIVGTFLLVVIVTLAAGGVYALSPGARAWVERQLPKPTPVEVRIEAAQRGALTRVVNAPGSIEPRTKVQISAQIVARVVALPFREGDVVRKGDVVVRLDAREYAAALESAQANLKGEQARLTGAEASVVQTQADLRRARELVTSGDLPASQLDDALAAALRAESSLQQTQHSIEVARAQITRSAKDLENTVIAAPFDGRVVKRDVEVGELVLVGTFNNPGSVIMEIADLSEMLMKARVDEANIAPISEGQSARVYINAYPGRSFDAVVERVGLKRLTDRDGTGYFEVEILVRKAADDLLRSGLAANVDVQVETLENVLKVPSQAVVERPWDELPADAQKSPLIDKTKKYARVVFVVREGKAYAVPVRAGKSDLTQTVIVEGLDGSEKLVVGPLRVLTTLKDEALVKRQTKGPVQGTKRKPSGKPSD
jgi:HlyD family secretion protein